MSATAGNIEEGIPVRRRWQAVVALVLLAVAALELLRLFTGLPWAEPATHAAMLLLVPVAVRRLGLREAYLLTLCFGVTWLLWARHPDPETVAAAALDQAAFLMTFVLLISFVQEAARTSPSVIACGLFLSRQPASRRFLALFAGGNLMTVVFNLGSVSLIAPLVRRAAEEAPDDPLTPVRERRQLSAFLRGVAWSVVWSPTAVAPLALMQLMPGADRGQWIALGLGVSVAMMAVGWAEDRWRWRHLPGRPPAGAPGAGPFPGRAAGGFVAVCGAFAVLTGAVMAMTGEGVPASLMLASPILLTAWLLIQNQALARPVVATGRQVREIVVGTLPLSAPAAVTLACSGYLGRAGADLVPASDLAAWIGLGAMPAWLFLTAIPLAIAAMAQLALSPIMMAVFFGSLLGPMTDLPASHTLTALAISTGWSLSMTCSPFASAVILLTRITGHTGARMTWHWNLRFSVLSALALAAIFWLLTGGK